MAYLTGKTAIVTGAAQGLGKEFAERLAAEGANDAVCDIREDVAALPDAISGAGLADGGDRELAPHNGHVNALAMRPTDTEMLRNLFKPGGKLAHLGGPDGPPPEILATFMDPANIARLLIDLLKDGRTGENIGIWAGQPIELGPRKRWDVRIRERADFTGQPLRDFGSPPWTDAPEPVEHLAVGRPA